MTREEIEKKTDAEVDHFIAEKVMGWLYDTVTGCECWIHDEGFRTLVNTFHPSTNLNQAIEAAEKVGLEQEGLSFGLVWNSTSRKWMAGWGAVAGWISSKPPALAVCRAIITAYEANKERKP